MTSGITDAIQTEANKRVANELLQGVFERGDFSLADRLLTDDFMSHEAPPEMGKGPASLKATAGWLRSAFSDWRYDIQDTMAEGDKVTVRLIFSGRHTGAFMGVPPTGRQFAVQHIHILRLEDGRVAEHWACRDDLGVFRQLGAFPSGGA